MKYIFFQGSQGYSSTESDFVDMDSFQTMQPAENSSLPELNLVGQVCQISCWQSTERDFSDISGTEML